MGDFKPEFGWPSAIDSLAEIPALWWVGLKDPRVSPPTLTLL